MGKNKWTRIGGVSGVLLLIFTFYTIGRLTSLGAFNQSTSVNENSVSVLAEIPGPEDLEIDRERGILFFISSNPCSEDPTRGGIYFIDLNQNPNETISFKFDHPQDFHPHGLSYFYHDSIHYLYTNNHRSDGTHSVEIFKITDFDHLQHLESLADPLLTSPNDLVAIGPRRFYVTNDGRAHDRLTRSIDTFLGLHTGSVLLFDGTKFMTSVDNLAFPNGITLDVHKNQIMVAETLSGFIKTYQIVEHNLLENVDNYYAGVGLDNISIYQNGLLLAAVHPNLLSLSRHMKNSRGPSPSKVLKIDRNSRMQETLYQNTGSEISGVSSVVGYRTSVYMGAVCESKLVQMEIRTGN